MKRTLGVISAVAVAALIAQGSFAADFQPGQGQGKGMGKRYGMTNATQQQNQDGEKAMKRARLHQQSGDRLGNPEECPYYQERVLGQTQETETQDNNPPQED